MDPAVLNLGLDLAMAFGADWQCPIQGRLAAQVPRLTAAERDAVDALCREVMAFGQGRLVACWRQAHGDQALAVAGFRRAVLARYPWVCEANLSRLFAQACYYAFRDGAI